VSFDALVNRQGQADMVRLFVYDTAAQEYLINGDYVIGQN